MKRQPQRRDLTAERRTELEGKADRLRAVFGCERITVEELDELYWKVERHRRRRVTKGSPLD